MLQADHIEPGALPELRPHERLDEGSIGGKPARRHVHEVSLSRSRRAEGDTVKHARLEFKLQFRLERRRRERVDSNVRVHGSSAGRVPDPQKIGPAMAVALLTTFYGSILANLVFTPCAGKLKTRTLLEVMNLEIVCEGSASNLDNNNPLTVYERLSSYIPAKKRKPLKRGGQEDE